MRRFAKKLIIFTIPFWAYTAFIAVTDPFDFLMNRSFVRESTKVRTASLLNPPLWKMIKFKRSQARSILLGDSRMGHIPVEDIRSITGEEHFNFWYGGATLREMIDTFWFAAKDRQLRNVVIGMNFNVYNDSGFSTRDAAMNRTATFASMRENPALYFLDRTVFQAAYLGVYADYLHGDPAIGIPQMSREEFWRHQLDYATWDYRSYARPRHYKAELEKVTGYCRAKGIHCVFLIPPTHVDLQRVVHGARLDAEYATFKADLARLATTYDFDYQNDLTANADNFADPYHFKDSVGKLVVREVWNGNLRHGRQLTAPSSL